MKLTDEYIRACLIPSDINEHLPTLYDLARTCNSVTELGVRDGISTRAFLFAGVKLRSYDLYLNPSVQELFKEAQIMSKDVAYLIGNSLKISLEPSDILFIDTQHTYQQLKTELELHSSKISKFIVLHDMESFGKVSEDGTTPGLVQAVEEFLATHKNWQIKEKFTNNNGLWIIEYHGY